MDYLLSLVGQDQDTIVDAIKDLAANAEKVKDQENHIKELNNKLDDHKEEIQYLKNKLDQKYDLIEDLEHDLDKTEEKVKAANDELGYQKNVAANKDRMISTLNEMRQESEDKCSKLEQKIDELKENLTQKSNPVDEQEEIQNLVKDIEHLRVINEEKEHEIKNISRRNEKLKVQLDDLNNAKKEEPKCLDDELGLNFSRKFACKECENKFASLHLLRSHVKIDHGSNDQISIMKIRLHKLEMQILEQKLDVTIKVSQLKEAEETCNCAGWCAINHHKHSWKKSSSKELHIKFQKLIFVENHTCNICEINVASLSHWEKHMKVHEEEHILETNNRVTNLSKTEGAISFHECESCEENFSSAGDFIFHIQNNHKTADVMFLQS
jgi:predicted RNase H-like nuclease (RuvC/YqgF family)